MKIIVGLGNPGRKYEKTRHNVGFLVLDEVAKRMNKKIDQSKFKAEYAEFFYNQEKVILIKPQTFMNLSGESVIQFAQYFSVEPEDILVISDDINLARGILRVRMNGSSGGQKGIQDIINKLKTNQFPRLRVGIGSDVNIETVNYVLGKIDSDVAIEKAADFIIEYIEGKSPQSLMNVYNQR